MQGGCRGRDRMVVGFTTAYAISAWKHWYISIQLCKSELKTNCPEYKDKYVKLM
jgi:hypothetical protein